MSDTLQGAPPFPNRGLLFMSPVQFQALLHLSHIKQWNFSTWFYLLRVPIYLSRNLREERIQTPRERKENFINHWSLFLNHPAVKYASRDLIFYLEKSLNFHRSRPCIFWTIYRVSSTFPHTNYNQTYTPNETLKSMLMKLTLS